MGITCRGPITSISQASYSAQFWVWHLSDAPIAKARVHVAPEPVPCTLDSSPPHPTPPAEPARLPGFHACVGGGGERQTAEWYKEKGIEYMTSTRVTGADIQAHTLTTAKGEKIKYGKLVVATGARVCGGDMSWSAGLLPPSIVRLMAASQVLNARATLKSIVRAFSAGVTHSAKPHFTVGGGSCSQCK